MSVYSLASFLLAVALLAMVPSPATALVIRRCVLKGPRAALPLIAGFEVGMFAWAVASALGIAALTATSKTAYVLLTAVGAGVLVVLGVRAWRSARRLPEVGGNERGTGSGAWRAAGAGAAINLANPTAAAFAFAFYPQFVPHGADVLRSTLLLALLQVVVDASWYLIVAVAVGKAMTVLNRTETGRRLERVVATVLVTLGVRRVAPVERFADRRTAAKATWGRLSGVGEWRR